MNYYRLNNFSTLSTAEINGLWAASVWVEKPDGDFMVYGNTGFQMEQDAVNDAMDYVRAHPDEVELSMSEIYHLTSSEKWPSQSGRSGRTSMKKKADANLGIIDDYATYGPCAVNVVEFSDGTWGWEIIDGLETGRIIDDEDGFASEEDARADFMNSVWADDLKAASRRVASFDLIDEGAKKAMRKKAALNLDGIVSAINANSDGLWDIKVDVQQGGGEYGVTLIDREEYITSYNYMDGLVRSEVFAPIEQSVKEQTGDQDFYLEPYDHVTFVGTAIEGGYKFETGVWSNDGGAYHKYYTSDGEIAGVVGIESGTGNWIWGVDDHGDLHKGTCDSADDGMAQADAYVYQTFGITASRKVAQQMSDSVRDWYVQTYPTDDMGTDIKDNVTFSGVALQLVNGHGDYIYDYIGAQDSLVRERVFQGIADILGVDYDTVYDAWRHGDTSCPLAKALMNKSASKTAEEYEGWNIQGGALPFATKEYNDGMYTGHAYAGGSWIVTVLGGDIVLEGELGVEDIYAAMDVCDYEFYTWYEKRYASKVASVPPFEEFELEDEGSVEYYIHGDEFDLEKPMYGVFRLNGTDQWSWSYLSEAGENWETKSDGPGGKTFDSAEDAYADMKQKLGAKTAMDVQTWGYLVLPFYNERLEWVNSGAAQSELGSDYSWYIDMSGDGNYVSSHQDEISALQAAGGDFSGTAEQVLALTFATSDLTKSQSFDNMVKSWSRKTAAIEWKYGPVPKYDGEWEGWYFEDGAISGLVMPTGDSTPGYEYDANLCDGYDVIWEKWCSDEDEGKALVEGKYSEYTGKEAAKVASVDWQYDGDDYCWADLSDGSFAECRGGSQLTGAFADVADGRPWCWYACTAYGEERMQGALDLEQAQNGAINWLQYKGCNVASRKTAGDFDWFIKNTYDTYAVRDYGEGNELAGVMAEVTQSGYWMLFDFDENILEDGHADSPKAGMAAADAAAKELGVKGAKKTAASTVLVDKLMEIDWEVWDFYDFKSGNDVDAHWQMYEDMVKELLDEQPFAYGDITMDALLELEDENYHSLLCALGNIGVPAAVEGGWKGLRGASRKKAYRYKGYEIETGPRGFAVFDLDGNEIESRSDCESASGAFEAAEAFVDEYVKSASKTAREPLVGEWYQPYDGLWEYYTEDGYAAQIEVIDGDEFYAYVWKVGGGEYNLADNYFTASHTIENVKAWCEGKLEELGAKVASKKADSLPELPMYREFEWPLVLNDGSTFHALVSVGMNGYTDYSCCIEDADDRSKAYDTYFGKSMSNAVFNALEQFDVPPEEGLELTRFLVEEYKMASRKTADWKLEPSGFGYDWWVLDLSSINYGDQAIVSQDGGQWGGTIMVDGQDIELEDLGFDIYDEYDAKAAVETWLDNNGYAGRYAARKTAGIDWEYGVTDYVDGTQGWKYEQDGYQAIIEPESNGDGTWYGYIYQGDEWVYNNWYETLDDAKEDLEDQFSDYVEGSRKTAAIALDEMTHIGDIWEIPLGDDQFFAGGTLKILQLGPTVFEWDIYNQNGHWMGQEGTSETVEDALQDYNDFDAEMQKWASKQAFTGNELREKFVEPFEEFRGKLTDDEYDLIAEFLLWADMSSKIVAKKAAGWEPVRVSKKAAIEDWSEQFDGWSRDYPNGDLGWVEDCAAVSGEPGFDAWIFEGGVFGEGDSDCGHYDTWQEAAQAVDEYMKVGSKKADKQDVEQFLSDALGHIEEHERNMESVCDVLPNPQPLSFAKDEIKMALMLLSKLASRKTAQEILYDYDMIPTLEDAKNSLDGLRSALERNGGVPIECEVYFDAIGHCIGKAIKRYDAFAKVSSRKKAQAEPYAIYELETASGTDTIYVSQNEAGEWGWQWIDADGESVIDQDFDYGAVEPVIDYVENGIGAKKVAKTAAWDWNPDDGYSGAPTHYEGDFAYVLCEPGDYYDNGWCVQVFDLTDEDAMMYGELYEEYGPFDSEEQAKQYAEGNPIFAKRAATDDEFGEIVDNAYAAMLDYLEDGYGDPDPEVECRILVESVADILRADLSADEEQEIVDIVIDELMNDGKM